MTTNELVAKLAASVVEFDLAGARKAAEVALAAQIDPLELVEGGAGGLRVVGDKFSSGEFYLPELILAAKVFEAVMDVINPVLEAKHSEQSLVGRYLLGTVEGDVHDIGVRIVGTLAAAAGFEVVNLGVSVPTATFVEKVRELKPDILGLSALLSTTMVVQREVIEALREAGLRSQVKVIIGGAPTSDEWALQIGADAYGADAAEGAEKIRALLGGQ